MGVERRYLAGGLVVVCIIGITILNRGPLMSSQHFLERKPGVNADLVMKLPPHNPDVAQLLKSPVVETEDMYIYNSFLFADEENSTSQYSTLFMPLFDETSTSSSSVSDSSTDSSTDSNAENSSGKVVVEEPLEEEQDSSRESSGGESKPKELNSAPDKSPILDAPVRDARYILTRRETPLNHVTFIKTHKCASSTIQNILMRYGYYHHLTFTLPNGGSNHIGWPRGFAPSMIRPSNPPDIHCYHSVFSKDLLNTMPADAFNLAAVRDPFTQMRSAYVYYGWFGGSKGKSLSTVLDKLISGPKHHSYISGAPTYNPVMLDMGMSVTDMANPAKVDAYIQYLNQTFQLVIVVEHFYESMIIMRDMLGWSNKDIASFGTNFRKEGGVTPKGVDLEDTPENRAKLYNYLSADKKLYDFFKAEMDKYIENNKEYLDKEVQGLKEYQQSLMNFCVEKSLPTSQIHDQRFRTWGNAAYGYVLTPQGLLNQTCIDMAMAELPWVGRLNSYQPPLAG